MHTMETEQPQVPVEHCPSPVDSPDTTVSGSPPRVQSPRQDLSGKSETIPRHPPPQLGSTEAELAPQGDVEAQVVTQQHEDAGTVKRPKSGYVPYNPYKLSRTTRQLLELTELPFMILWVYLTYFIVIVALTASKVRKLVWVSAVVAGTLVGVGLNANAYRAIMYRGYPDVGMIVRFFLIPFGVSALSGLTNSLRDRFMLVFPKNPVELVIAVACPTVVVCTLMLSRIIILRQHRVPTNLRNFFLNGRIYF
ncbi:transmembrane protein [Cystoisospora suis]|uniref:Transmembrane protein n=1 Tax=Cystoisospora suis TaxID=483139 RepID=A0A2C6LGS3_9APIC|nr:transmembrane protein [Cystoisospora suis]